MEEFPFTWVSIENNWHSIFARFYKFYLIIGDKLFHFIILYWSPNLSHDEFNSFIKNLELNLYKATNYNPFLFVALDEFIYPHYTIYLNIKLVKEFGLNDYLYLSGRYRKLSKFCWKLPLLLFKLKFKVSLVVYYHNIILKHQG